MLSLRATRPRLLARRFILARTLTSSNKIALLLPFYSPSSISLSSLIPRILIRYYRLGLTSSLCPKVILFTYWR